MNNKAAVECIRKNWPPSSRTMLIEALECAIAALEAAELATAQNMPMVEIERNCHLCTKQEWCTVTSGGVCCAFTARSTPPVG